MRLFLLILLLPVLMGASCPQGVDLLAAYKFTALVPPSNMLTVGTVLAIEEELNGSNENCEDVDNVKSTERLKVVCAESGASALRTSACDEAGTTAACNGYAAAAVGAVVGFFIAGPAGALAGAFKGGLTVGAASGLAQGLHCASSNDFRQFAEDCNEWLLHAREYGLSVETARMLRALEANASTDEKKRLVKEIVEVCVECVGEAGAGNLHGIAGVLPPRPRPPAPAADPSYMEMWRRNDYAGYSPFGGGR